MTKILNKNVSLLLFIFAFAFFILQGYIALDPDFGWHLRFGEIISQTNQIPKTDPFSYTMPSYHFIDHEWLSDLIIAKSYPFLGQIGLSFIFALIAISAVFLQLKNLPKKWSFIPLCLIFSILLFFQGIRPQIISLFFMSLLIITLFNKKIYQKLKYFIPFVFLIWANLHGSFPVGLVVLGTFILSEIIEKRRISWGNLFILLASVFITFINPYGISLWKEILVTALDASLKWSVQEWTPSFFVVNIPLWVFLSLSGFIFIKYFTKFDLKEKMLFIILLLFGLSSIRNMLFFLFIGLIIIAKGFNFFYSTLGKYPLAKQRFFKAYMLISFFCFVMFVLSFITSPLLGVSEDKFYPKGAVNYLLINPGKGELFSTYNWGGYLIWKLPQKKVFVDGRMPSWRSDNNLKNESSNAFLEQVKVFRGEVSLGNVINKYNIDTFLLPRQNLKKINAVAFYGFLYSLLNIKNPDSDNGIFSKDLNKLGMKVIYQDSMVNIYRKF